MSEAEDVLRKYLKAQEDKDLESLVSCWADDIEAFHPLRPDRSWRGIDTYRRAWTRIYETQPNGRFDVLSADVVGNRIYLDILMEHGDGTMIPCMNIMEVENGKIRRVRVYTDVPTSDGQSMDNFVDELNPDA
jgi:hypothetical protein